MSWTNADKVKTHLLGFSVNSLTVRETEVILGDDDVQLPHRNIETGSVRVAALLEDKPTGPVSVVLTGTTWYSIGEANLKIASVLVGKDNQPMDRYIEGVDYAVDYDTGEIRRLPDSGIVSGSTVYIWYLPLTVFIYHNDYAVNHAEGVLSRTVGGDIPDPARLLVNYRTSGAGATDSLISLAIVEAEDKIASRLREEYDETSTDQGLKTGATELTLSVICDDLALEALGSAADSGADDRARRFMELARRFEERAVATLARFLTRPLRSETRLQPNPAPRSGW